MDLPRLLGELAKLSHEAEWVEFKKDFAEPDKIGEYISALSNSATLCGQPHGYIAWGVENNTHNLVGTKFDPWKVRIGNEDLEPWLTRLLEPRLHFTIHEFEIDGNRFVLFCIPAAARIPTRFKHEEYIRVGQSKKKLRDYPEKARELWARLIKPTGFERGTAAERVSAKDVLATLNIAGYLDLIGPKVAVLPSMRAAVAPIGEGTIFDLLEQHGFIVRQSDDRFDITNLGALLVASDLRRFGQLARKSARVIVYDGVSRVKTVRESIGRRGYAVGFDGVTAFIEKQIPESEEIGRAFRTETKIYPQIAVRELVANAIIHQDLDRPGTGPRVEIFDDRLEISNPGVPLIDTQRFLDAPPLSRNDALAAFMHEAKICEERGSGIDKVFFWVEFYQLPPVDFAVDHSSTTVVLFAPRKLAQMGKDERIRACYQHAGLQRVSNKQMTNASLRKRLGISEANYAIASRIIRDTLNAGLIKAFDPTNKSKSQAKYVPYWSP